MPSVKHLDVGDDESLTVHQLPRSKKITCQSLAVSTHGRVWAIDGKGKLLASRFGDLRAESGYAQPNLIPIKAISAADIVALGALGCIQADTVEQRRKSAIRAAAIEREIKSIKCDVDSLTMAGIKVPKTWKKLAAAHATTKVDEYMKRNYA